MTLHRQVVFFGALIAMTAGVSRAQSIFGEIRGTVTDPSGAVIAGANVDVRNTATGESRRVNTDSSGNYSVVNIEAGPYQVSIEGTGFRKMVVENVMLRAREVARVDARLEIAQASTEVMVAASRQVVTTDVATVADSKSSSDIQNLPVNFRAGSTNSVFSAIALAPGVQPSGSSDLSLAGSMPFMNTASVDGISTINVRSNGLLTEMFPSAETIDEIRVSSISNNAEFAQAGDVTTTSKGGTNAYHGSLFWYHQNGAMDARDFFSTRQGAPFKISNDFGFSAGGPVIHNKTFFFGAYEALRYRAQNQINQVVPPDSYRNGNLSSVTTPIRDPLGGTFAGNIIPASRISPVSQKILEGLYPHATVPGDSISSSNYRVQAAAGNRNDQFDIRGDHVFNERNNIFVRYSFKDVTRSSPDTFPAIAEDRSAEENRTLVGAYNSVIRPSLINEFRAGYTRRPRFVDFGPNGGSFNGPALVKSLGIQGIRPDPPTGASVPDFGITGFVGTGHDRGFTQLSQTIQVNDNLTWIKGRHAFKFGVDLRRIRTTDDIEFFAGDDMGEYRFNGMFTGNAMADFLLGYPNRTRLANTSPDINGHTLHHGYYAQDDFKVNPRLTLNFGVRYEYHPPFWDETLQLANFDRDYPGGRVIVPNQASLALTAAGFRASIGNTPIITAAEAGIPDTLRYGDKNNFAPRIGFAWRPFGNKTVLRGGYGIYTVTILGAVFYSLTGIHTSDTRTFNNSLAANGLPALQFPTPFGSGLGALTAVGNADFRRGNGFHSPDPYAQQWHFTVERDLGWNTGLRITYSGSHTIKLFSSPDLNQVRPNTVGYSTAKLSRPYPNWAIVYSRDAGGSAKYNSLTTEVQKRFSNHLFFQSAWVWAKNLTNAAGSDATGFPGEAGSVPTDRFNLGLDYGNAAATRRHRWQSTFTYALPSQLLKSSSAANKVGNFVVGGWQLSGILLFQTGPFTTPITGGATDPSGTNVDSRANDRPDYTGTTYGNIENRTIARWWDRNAFVRPPSNIGRFGAVGPGQLIGPGTQVVSAKLQKRFNVRESSYFQVEGGATNLLNHTNFGIPGRNTSAATFGVIAGTQSLEGSGARQLQVGLRFSF